jgi:hypothetical protein
MSRCVFGTRLHQVFGTLRPSRRDECRRKLNQSPRLESLEGRALMATINASATISSVADGANFDYTVTLNNSSSSSAAVGTFWYAWTPGHDYLATNPISVSPPAGWTDKITHSGAGDGYAIQFLASNSVYDVQPGGSMNFTFESADTPASVNGNSVFYPGTPVGTSFVYQGNFGDGGHQFSVTPPSTPTPTPTPTPTGPLVTVTNVQDKLNKRHMVTEIIVDFSGAVNASEADSLGTYRLATAGKKGSFAAKNAKVLKLKSAVYNGASWAVALTPKKAFALTMPVQLLVSGQSLQDSEGRLIDGANDGQPGSNFVTVFRRTAPVTPAPTPTPYPGY